MEETIISRKNLAERWGKTTETIIQYEQKEVVSDKNGDVRIIRPAKKLR